jgi:hypothetical protein
MDNLRKKKLIALGPEILSQALLDLVSYYDGANEVIDRLISTPQENAERFENKLLELKEMDIFYDYKDASKFVLHLNIMLNSLKSDTKDPNLGLNLIIKFYESDEYIFNAVDDSYGNVDDLFSNYAQEVFLHFATLCTDEDKIVNAIVNTNKTDNYSIRIGLVECASKCLPENKIREIINTFQNWIEKSNDEYVQKDYMRAISSLAKQINDAKLYEETTINLNGKKSKSFLYDVGQVYFESGDYETALSRLMELTVGDSSLDNKKDKLLIKIYAKQGKNDKLVELLVKDFNSNPSLDTMQNLLDNIGEKNRDEIISNKVSQILKDDVFHVEHVNFMISVGNFNEAENYILKNANQVSGYGYMELPPIAILFEKEKRPLVASIILRSLLNSILESGNSKAYYHGAEYLRKLDYLNISVKDWQIFETHEEYFIKIHENHGRKWRFWSIYKADVDE